MSKRHPSDPRQDTRERVRKLLAKGLNHTQTAQRLNISRQRVGQHAKRIREEERQSA